MRHNRDRSTPNTNNFAQDIVSINKDYTSLYFAMYMQDMYGVEVGYIPVDMEIINMHKELAEWQLASDCCSLCTQSAQPIPGTITQYCSLPATSDTCSPFQPLYAGGHFKPCNV